jgi:hypothetical protein
VMKQIELYLINSVCMPFLRLINQILILLMRSSPAYSREKIDALSSVLILYGSSSLLVGFV